MNPSHLHAPCPRPGAVYPRPPVLRAQPCPSFMLVAEALRPPGTPIATFGELALYALGWTPMASFRLSVAIIGPALSPTSRGLERVVLERRRLGAERVFGPWERRRLARQGSRGRRSAMAIPCSAQWGASIYATEGAPEATIRAAAESVYVVVKVTWSRRR